jgi:hypothetical protein
MPQNVFPGGVPLRQEVSACKALPANTTPVTVPMTCDGGAVVARQDGEVTGASSTTVLNCLGMVFDANIVGSYLVFKTGANAHLWRTVKTRTDNDTIVTDPFPDNFVAGDMFLVEKPKNSVHTLDLWLPTTFTNTVWVAVGPVVAGNNTPRSLPVSGDLNLHIESRDGFTDISIYVGADYSTTKYNLRAI